MNRKLFFIMLFCLLTIPVLPVYSQNNTDTQTLAEQFPNLFYRDNFQKTTDKDYYRFSMEVPCFDPLDLSYFPHETWDQSDWGLLGRWQDSWNYHQMLLLPESAKTWVFHGTSPGRDVGYLNDFYIYMTLFVTDSYPEDLGSCYVYYSDSLVQGFGESKGLLIDPQSGIYRVDNYYKVPYNLTNKNHELNIVQKLNPDDFPFPEDDISSSYIGASVLSGEYADKHLEGDLETVKTASHLPGTSVNVYRIELIRLDGHLKVYINGVLTAELEDEVGYLDEAENFIPERVSWSYGPLLYTGGVMVDCAVGDFYIRDTGKIVVTK